MQGPETLRLETGDQADAEECAGHSFVFDIYPATHASFCATCQCNCLGSGAAEVTADIVIFAELSFDVEPPDGFGPTWLGELLLLLGRCLYHARFSTALTALNENVHV